MSNRYYLGQVTFRGVEYDGMPSMQDSIRDGLRAELDQPRQRAKPEFTWVKTRVTELEHECRRLARGVVDGSIPGDLAREEQGRIATELEQAQKGLTTIETIFSRIDDILNRALALLGRRDEGYRLGGPQARRFADQCFFKKLLIAPQDAAPAVTSAILCEPWATLYAEDFQHQMIHNTTNLDQDLLVEVRK